MTDSESSANLGRPWTIVGTFPTYEIAAAKAAERKGTKGLEIKIKQLSTGFSLRTRRSEKEAPAVSTSEQITLPSTKKSKLRAKDRRVLERSTSNEDEFDSSSDKTT